jgi:hypothetical protein
MEVSKSCQKFQQYNGISTPRGNAALIRYKRNFFHLCLIYRHALDVVDV